jgi:hypothetical protein
MTGTAFVVGVYVFSAVLGVVAWLLIDKKAASIKREAAARAEKELREIENNLRLSDQPVFVAPFPQPEETLEREQAGTEVRSAGRVVGVVTPPRRGEE